jgi:hypothetical protein
MKKCILLIALFVPAGFPLPVAAIDSPPPQTSVLIAAVQTGQVGVAGNDFVVLHNPGDQDVDVTGWRLQYRAASSKTTDTWTTKRMFGCTDVAPDCKLTIPAGQNLIASTYEMPALAVQKMSSGFSDVGGQIRLVRPTGSLNQLEAVDVVGYGSAVEAEGEPAAAPTAGKVIVRKSNAVGTLIDTDNNKNDFAEGCFTPSLTNVPVLTACAPRPPQEPTPPDEEDEDQEVPVVYTVLEISELLPDPVSPAVDSKDEFIEIHNPSTENVQLKGYVVQAGSDFKDTFTLGDQVLPAGGYVSLMSADSHVGLTNSGTAVRLLDPSGKVIAVVQSYGQAKPGAAWVQWDGVWQWTLQPTPGMANILQIEPPVAPAVATPKKATTKKAAVKAAGTTKAVKSATTAKPKPPAAAKTAAATPPPEPQPAQNFNFLILTLVGLGVLAYATFEYRHEIARFGRRAWATITRQPYIDPTHK